MKKVLFVVFVSFLMVGSTMAQLPISKDNFFVNANTSDFRLSFSDGTSFNLGAHGGYFLADKLALVGGLTIEASDGYNAFGIQAGARYYFLEQSKGSFFASGLLGVRKQKDVDATFGLTLNAGYAIFLNEHVALEPMVNLWLPFSSDYDVIFSIGGGISVYF